MSRKPNGHEGVSAFVMAYSQEEARQRVRVEVENYTVDIAGFDTDYYDVRVYSVGKVVFNDND